MYHRTRDRTTKSRINFVSDSKHCQWISKEQFLSNIFNLTGEGHSWGRKNPDDGGKQGPDHLEEGGGVRHSVDDVVILLALVKTNSKSFVEIVLLP